MKKVLSLFIVFSMLVTGILAVNIGIAADEKVGTNKTYSSSVDFLAAEGKICSTATNGCNTHILNNGALGVSTEKYCEDVYGVNGQEKWSCLNYKAFSDRTSFLGAYGNTCTSASDGCNTYTINNGEAVSTTLKYCEDVNGTSGQAEWTCLNFVNYYNTSLELLNAEGKICKTATDGCNTGSIVDGRIEGMTRKYCEDIYGTNGKEKWSCASYGDEDGLQIVDNEGGDVKVCTMEYAPVCGVDGKTYGNACMAGEVVVAYEGECKTSTLTEDTMSYVDQAYLDALLQYKTYAQVKFEPYTVAQLNKMIETIDKAIENTKLLKIAVAAQKTRITQYVFIRAIVQAEIEAKS